MTAAALAMNDPGDARRRRRTIRLALIHVLIALAFLAAFVWSQVQR